MKKNEEKTVVVSVPSDEALEQARAQGREEGFDQAREKFIRDFFAFGNTQENLATAIFNLCKDDDGILRLTELAHGGNMQTSTTVQLNQLFKKHRYLKISLGSPYIVEKK